MSYFRLYDDSGMDPLSVLAQWPWSGIVLIFVAAVLSVAVILFTTRRAIRDMAASARKTMSELTASAPAFSGAGQAVVAITTGRGAVAFKSGGFVVPLAYRAKAETDLDIERVTDRALVMLASRIEGTGLDIRDFDDERMGILEDGHVTIRASFSVRDATDVTKVLAAALAAGFAEETAAGRVVITLDDAERVAGERAIDEATRNAETVFEALTIERKNALLLFVELESDPTSTATTLRRVAKVHWSRGQAAA